MKEAKKIVEDNQENLYNKDRILYNIIYKYSIGHNFLAQHLYPAEWDDKDMSMKKKLTGRIRNKLDGNGKLTENEYTDIINTLSEMASSIDRAVTEAIANKTKIRKEKIAKLLEGLDQETLSDLKKML